MQVTIPDKRKKLKETPVICCVCGYPEIEVLSECHSKTKSYIAYAVGPHSEEEALASGWTEGELGIACPICSGLAMAEVAVAEAEGSGSHVGAAGLTNALATDIAEATGEASPDTIKEEDLELPTVHHLKTVIEEEYKTNDADNGEHLVQVGVATCARCGTKWDFQAVDGTFATDPPYVRECIPAAATEHLPPSVHTAAPEKTNE